MELIVKNKIITSPIRDILLQIQHDTQYLKDIRQEKHSNISITCPWHKNGQESHPSCFVFSSRDSDEVQYGFVKCFTCGKTVPLYSLVGYCYGFDDEFGKQWLADNFGAFVEENIDLPEIVIDTKTKVNNYLDEKILDQYNYYHPYLAKRKISEEVGKRFKVGYDKETNSITFPIWDYRGGLIGITERNVDTKRFTIPPDMNKAVYLLNFIREDNIDIVIVVEGQFDALRAWSNGYPAVAMLGAGTTKHQMEILNKSGVHHFILMYDNDEAGRKGAEKFKNLIRGDVFVTDIVMPPDRDVGDCSREELEEILLKNGILKCLNY